MLRPSLAGLGVLLMLAACGGAGSANTPQGPTAASVAVQPADLPSDMHKCDLSGDIDTIINKLKAKDAASAKSFTDDWNAAKKNGATAVYASFYADTTAHCTNIESSTSDVGAATYKLVVNFVIQFNDDASAIKGYTTETIFGFSSSSLKGGGAPVVEGANTGLGTNSIVLSLSVASQSFYVAVWQKKAFMVILAVLNTDSATGKKIATAENSRIK